MATIIECRKVWKLFGVDAKKIFQQHGSSLSPQTIADANLICGVRNVSFDIEEGENFVIMGLSGSGKSTLVRCLTRLIEPTGGEIRFEGADLLRAKEQELIYLRRHKIGMVFQHFALLPHLNVLGNVAFPLEVQGSSRTEREKRAFEVIELVGLKGRESHFPRELSGGQQQRVGIARALAVNPNVLFMDEPFSALDPLIRREMQDEFLRLRKLLKKTIVFITHDFNEAIRIADRIAIMKDGEVIQIGTPEELLLHPETNYVAEFTKNVDRAKVLTVSAVMKPAESHPELTKTVSDKATIAQVASEVLRANKAFGVQNEAGELVGTLTPDTVLNVMVDDLDGGQT
jgi:glycine betaine/proline transport system ATP-binding protein